MAEIDFSDPHWDRRAWTSEDWAAIVKHRGLQRTMMMYVLDSGEIISLPGVIDRDGHHTMSADAAEVLTEMLRGERPPQPLVVGWTVSVRNEPMAWASTVA